MQKNNIALFKSHISLFMVLIKILVINLLKV